MRPEHVHVWRKGLRAVIREDIDGREARRRQASRRAQARRLHDLNAAIIQADHGASHLHRRTA